MVCQHSKKQKTKKQLHDLMKSIFQTPTGISTGNELSAYCKDHWIDGRCVVVHFGRIYFSIIVFASACIMRSNANVRFNFRKGADVGNIASKFKLEGYILEFIKHFIMQGDSFHSIKILIFVYFCALSA